MTSRATGRIPETEHFTTEQLTTRPVVSGTHGVIATGHPLVSIAGIVFPYRLKSVWQSAGGGRLFGVPTVTLAGIGGVLVLGAFAYEFLFNSVINATFAVTRQLSLEFMIGVPIIGIVWYAAAYFINRSRGIDLSLAYKELPPE